MQKHEVNTLHVTFRWWRYDWFDTGFGPAPRSWRNEIGSWFLRVIPMVPSTLHVLALNKRFQFFRWRSFFDIHYLFWCRGQTVIVPIRILPERQKLRLKRSSLQAVTRWESHRRNLLFLWLLLFSRQFRELRQLALHIRLSCGHILQSSIWHACVLVCKLSHYSRGAGFSDFPRVARQSVALGDLE